MDRFTPEKLTPEANVAMVARPDGTYVRWADVEEAVRILEDRNKENALQALTSEGQWIESFGEAVSHAAELRKALEAVLPYAVTRAEDLNEAYERIQAPPGEAATPDDIELARKYWEKAEAAITAANEVLSKGLEVEVPLGG